MNPLPFACAERPYVPDAVLTNQDLAKVVNTNEEWIVTRTGIKQRHRLADDENASGLELKAARKAPWPTQAWKPLNSPTLSRPLHA